MKRVRVKRVCLCLAAEISSHEKPEDLRASLPPKTPQELAG